MELLYLVVEDHLPAVVCFVEEVQILQYGGIIEYSLHDVVPADPRDLSDQQEGELVGRVYLPPPSLPLGLVLLLLQSLRLLILRLQEVSLSSLTSVFILSVFWRFFYVLILAIYILTNAQNKGLGEILLVWADIYLFRVICCPFKDFF